MRRLSRFAISKRPYAVDMSSLRRDGSHVLSEVTAVWFRRRRGETVACWGRLWDFQDPAPLTAYEFLKRHEDGRYGGDAAARWDGANLWAPEMSFDKARELQDLLRRVLDDYPAIPDGYDGWWTFQ